VVSWRLWNAPSDYAKLLRRLQQRRCAETGARLWKTCEVDHRVPLFRVWREHRDMEWPVLLSFWGLPNLQVINRDAHTAKCAAEAGTRRRAILPAARPRESGDPVLGPGFPLARE
jgi:5-methylcytosine-specific restriction endonuclease McrA